MAETNINFEADDASLSASFLKVEIFHLYFRGDSSIIFKETIKKQQPNFMYDIELCVNTSV
ncbi:hypothetical protein RO3G_15742 [Rhizopus delemar RA 99-880]|uniref:Uncharacterized protein n=1 Tax=Rhizopus delemar (strain RA 99-880 / ATCC MYA-4621 / FGSC 9543 / NRRL 43880) TaxID=246409 RepID=I1CRF1_RHIO9|nr:hypothetical protein RO3G_15742 [Rhizopus delemar RA 99-880]|eukprot:EIE91031.1 hypothetical protein RO3G_15742 [Rhizopus delemar RA 99-880]